MRINLGLFLGHVITLRSLETIVTVPNDEPIAWGNDYHYILSRPRNHTRYGRTPCIFSLHQFVQPWDRVKPTPLYRWHNTLEVDICLPINTAVQTMCMLFSEKANNRFIPCLGTIITICPCQFCFKYTHDLIKVRLSIFHSIMWNWLTYLDSRW